MANPRKFSEKIAMHTHRQAEETARFEQIMKEVSVATARVHPSGSSSSRASATEVSEKPARNVNQLRITTPTTQQQQLGSYRGGSLPNVAAPTTDTSPPHHNHQQQQKEECKPEETNAPLAPTLSMSSTSSRESRTRSPCGPIRRPQQERKHDTSPYSSSSGAAGGGGGGGAFLSPPPDSAWRRTHSDPALHQATDGSAAGGGGGGTVWMQALNGPATHHHHHHDHHHDTTGRRPRSSCDVPRVPGINIFYSEHEPGAIPIPIGNNTGSLPDLTSVHFPAPLHTPLDADQEQPQLGSSPYSSSPVNTSPSTLSPTSVPPEARTQGRFQFTPPSVSNQNHLSVPVSSRFLHHNKGVTLDNTFNDPQQQSDFTQMHRIYQQQQVPPTASSPTGGYRSPRPSPQSSPSLGGRHSAPCSPSAPSPLSPLPNEYQAYSQHQHQAAQLQQHFEQISMMDMPQTSANAGHAPTQPCSMAGMGMDSGGGGGGDAGYFSTSPSQLVYQTTPASLHTTPNTPTSIPDIILTDFSAEDISRQELSLTKQIENELFGTDALREGLEPLDIDSLQLLTHSDINLIADGVEDHFRMDRS